MVMLTMSEQKHIPVLLNEAIEALNVRPGRRYVDCTLGLGGHSLAILEKGHSDIHLLGIDADPEAISIAKSRLLDYSLSTTYVNDNFGNLESICYENRPGRWYFIRSRYIINATRYGGAGLQFPVRCTARYAFQP